MAKKKSSKNKKINPKNIKLIIVALAAGLIGLYVLVKTQAATPATGNCVKYSFKEGAKGDCVGYIQTLANWKIDVKPKLKADKAFGSKTTTGIKQLQKAFKLTQDGVVGANTWRRLCSSETALNKGGTFDSTTHTAYKKAGCDYFKVTPCIQQVFNIGSSGECVKNIRYFMGQFVVTKLGIDNTFDTSTKNVVKEYQGNRNLQVDGVVGKDTWESICKEARSSFRNATLQSYADKSGCPK